MDPGIGHEIEADLQTYGYPILWAQYLPVDADLMQWLFGDELRKGTISSPFDVRDVWPSSYNGNTNEILWGAKIAARLPRVTCVIPLASYECGMDQPTYTPVQKIVEGSGRCSFRFRTSTPPSRRDPSRSGSRPSPTTWSVRRLISSRARSCRPQVRVRC
jgi:predicted nucleotide-binding protein (sugar kinase/HSP70/actin superfamily)